MIDVKAFRDKIFKLIRETFNDVLRENKIDDLHMLPEIDCYICYKQITKNRGKVKNEIREALQQILQSDNKELVKRSEIIDCLKYRFLKGSGILTGYNIFNPYFFAMQEHKIAFEHINKLHMDNPSILMYVIHPWFSDTNLTTGFDRTDEIALRSFSRRIFMQYKNKQIKIGGKEIINLFQFLSAILLIVDNSIRNEEDQLFFYVNPNAKHKINPYFKDSLQNYCFVDDFAFDNY